MLAEFFKVVRDHFTDQAKVAPVVVPFSRSKRVKTYWDPAKREVVEVTEDRPESRHLLLSVQAIIDYVEGHADKTPTNIWIGKKLITVEATEHSERDVLTMALNFSPLFAKLLALRDNPSVPQAEAIRLMRQHFSPWDIGARGLTAVRSIKVSSGSDIESDQSHVSSRLGKSIMQSAAGASELPEYIDVAPQVYLRGGKVGHTVRVWLSIDFAKAGNILFEPDATQLEEAMIAERLEIQAELQQAFQDLNVTVYEGEYLVVAS